MKFQSKNQNITNLLRYVHNNNGANKFEISEKISVSPAAVTKISKRLITDKIFQEKSIIDDKKRKKNLLVINYDRFISIGVYIKEEETKVVFTNMNNTIIWEMNIKKFNLEKFSDFLKSLFLNIEEFIKEKNINIKDILGMGVIVSSEILSKNILFFFKKEKYEEFQEYAKSHLDIPIFLETEERAQGLYEAFLHPEHENFYLIKYGETRGSSTIINNKLINPVIPYHRSIGVKHIIVEPNSEIYCDICRKRGCLETMIAPKYLYKEIIKENNYSEEISNLYFKMEFKEFLKRAENQGIIEGKTLKKIAKYLSILMIDHNTMFALDKFLLSGKIFESELFINYLKMYLQDFQLDQVQEEIIVLKDYENKEILSASYLPINYIFYNYHFDDKTENHCN